MELTRKERILGCLIDGAYGDALGVLTENRTREQIFEEWGYVDRLYAPPSDVFTGGNQTGQVTDDLSMVYMTITEILKHDRMVNDEVAKSSLVEWSKGERFFEQFVGPISRKFINRLKGLECKVAVTKFEPVNDNLRAPNGGVMKIGPVSLFTKGDMNKATRPTEMIYMPTHGNRISLSAACGVAAPINSALMGHDLCQILQDGLEGTRYGKRTGKEKGIPIAGPSMEKRMKLAIRMGFTAEGLSGAMDCMRRYSDCNGVAADSVPVSSGLMAAAGGDVCRAVEAAVNIGNDTNTIATIVGAVLGTSRGNRTFDGEIIHTINQVNDYELGELAGEIEQYQIIIREGNESHEQR